MENKLISMPKNITTKINIKIVLIIIGIVIAIAFIIFLVIYNNDSNKLKRYLVKQGYDCKKDVCLQITKDGIKTINYHNGNYKYETNDYTFSINKSLYSYEEKKVLKCTYPNDDKEIVDNNSNPQQCNKNIEKMNNEIKYYNKLMDESKFKKK